MGGFLTVPWNMHSKAIIQKARREDTKFRANLGSIARPFKRKTDSACPFLYHT